MRDDRGQRAPFPCHVLRLIHNNSFFAVPMSLKSNTTQKPDFTRDQGVYIVNFRLRVECGAYTRVAGQPLTVWSQSRWRLWCFQHYQDSRRQESQNPPDLPLRSSSVDLLSHFPPHFVVATLPHGHLRWFTQRGTETNQRVVQRGREANQGYHPQPPLENRMAPSSSSLF